MPLRPPIFGFGASTLIAEVPATLRLAAQADRDGLDLLTVSDHAYFSDRLDAYAALGIVLGRTERICGLVSVTNLPTRPAPMLARTVTSLSALSGGRIVLGMGAGGLWDEIARFGVPRLGPAAAVRAFAEGITLVKALSGDGGNAAGTDSDPKATWDADGLLTFDGEFYQVHGLRPAPVPPPPVWTGSVGPQSLAVTGRLADGWIPGHAADWHSERYRNSRPVIDAAAEQAGRARGDVATIYNLPGVITTDPLAATRDRDGRWLGGSVGQWVEELTGAVLDHGASGFVLFPARGEPDEVSIARWAREIAPAVREAVAAAAG
ncbi:MAG TPA: LLM class flavin-dependent oxidoreductase [Actinocrinis sp.]|nr:LLM class flavin-dependent oxidoreductase [Actinocrinis sp.]